MLQSKVDQEKISWLRLAKTAGIGFITLKHLITKFQTATNVLANFDEFIKKLNIKGNFFIPDATIIEKQIKLYEQNNIKIILPYEKEYPKLLLHLSDYPSVLYCKGNISLLKETSIAIVGSRNASLTGISFTQKIAKELVNNNLVIVSGMAKGIDAAAHLISPERTIAVLGCGVDVIYPQENIQIYEQILEKGGLIVSTFELGTQPRPNFFSYRNKIIAGLSLGTLVTEAAIKSGSLMTAKYALDQGKDVFAVPGHPLDLRAQGTNYLIKNGAILTQSAYDILQNISNNTYEQAQIFEEIQHIAEVNSTQIKEFLKDKLTLAEIEINEILKNCEFPVSQVQAELAEMELMQEIIIERNVVKKRV